MVKVCVCLVAGCLVAGWSAAEAVPPTTAPLIETMVTQGRLLRPDALTAEPRPLRMETVPKRCRLQDR